VRPLIVIAGPTGTGKSALALRLALTLHGEIVNYDSVQIYRGFDIGSAKPSIATRALVPHHLFDIIEATDEFNAADYARLARTTCEGITARGKVPILAGGTFFYLRALLSGLPEMPGRDDELRARVVALLFEHRGNVTAVARAMGVPARYVSGYIHFPGEKALTTASHAWAEAWVAGRGWIGFDATHPIRTTPHHVRLAVGRDYTDAAPTRGVYVGSAGSSMSISVRTRAAG